MKLLIVQRIFSNYRKPIFDKLAAEFELSLVHSKNKSGIKQAQATYANQVKSWLYGKGETSQFLWFIPDILKFKPRVLIHEMALGMPSLYFTVWLQKLLGYHLIIWGHGYNRKKGFNPKHSFEDKVRFYLLRNAKAILLYDFETKKLLNQYLPNEKLFVAPNTLNTEKLLNIRDSLRKRDRQSVLKELNWSKKFNLIYIGRLLSSKHPEKLFEILYLLNNTHQLDVAVHIIGSGPEETSLKNRAKKFNNIHFYGSIHDEHETGKMLFASNLMVIPGAVGLSVNHAFAFDCPVATFSKSGDEPYHGPEITYVTPETGFIIPAFNCELMASTIAKYLSNLKHQQNMRKNAGLVIESTASITKMLDGFKLAIQYVCINK